MYKIFYIFFLCSLLTACSEAILFEEPQPAGAEILIKFPEKIQGEYQSLSNRSVLHISDSLITRVYDFNIKEHINNLDPNYRLKGDTLLDLDIGEKIIVKIIDDTIYHGFYSLDTLFYISENNVLKKYKSHYFLSTTSDNISWSVKKLSANKGKLFISTISGKEDIALLKEITETQADTTAVKFKPTQKQFKKFIKENGFNETEEFIRIKK